MVKKFLYPLGDWNWLKIPLGSLVIGFTTFVAFASFAGTLAFFREHTGLIAITGTLLYVLVMFLSTAFPCALVGYLFKVAVLPSQTDDLKLPDWSGFWGMAWSGFVAIFGCVLLASLFQSILLIPAVLTLVASGVTGSVLAINEMTSVAGVTAILGGGVSLFLYVGALVVSLVFTVLFASILQPLLLLRYAHTRQFRHLFDVPWAWRALTIAPWEYLLRTSAWGFAVLLIVILTPLTMGFSHVFNLLVAPLSAINSAYLLGEYYHKYLND